MGYTYIEGPSPSFDKSHPPSFLTGDMGVRWTIHIGQKIVHHHSFTRAPLGLYSGAIVALLMAAHMTISRGHPVGLIASSRLFALQGDGRVDERDLEHIYRERGGT